MMNFVTAFLNCVGLSMSVMLRGSSFQSLIVCGTNDHLWAFMRHDMGMKLLRFELLVER